MGGGGGGTKLTTGDGKKREITPAMEMKMHYFRQLL